MRCDVECVLPSTSLISTVLMGCVDERVRPYETRHILKVNVTSEHLQCELTDLWHSY